MSLILLDGCEDFSAFAQSGAVVSPGRYQNGIRLTSSSTQFVYRPLPTQESDTMTVGFAVRQTVAAASTCNLLTFFSDFGVTTHNTIRITSTGALEVTRSSTALFTTAAAIIAAGNWYYMEIQVKLHDTTGSVTLKVNGATVGTFTGDTKNAGTKTVYDTLQWVVSSSHTVDFDDVYVMAGAGDSFLGNLTVETLLPTADAGGIGEFEATGPEERITVGGTPDADQNLEMGLPVSFNAVGRINALRYYRRATTDATLNLNVWDTDGTRLAGPIPHTSAVVGYHTVTLPEPVYIAAGQTVICSYGGSFSPCHSFVIDAIASSAHCSSLGVVVYGTIGTFPTNSFWSMVYCEPIFEPGTFGGDTNTWHGSDGDSTNNYQLVDDPHPISRRDYVYNDVIGEEEVYALSNLAHTSGTVVGVCHSADMIRTDTTTPMNVKLINRGAVDTKSASITLSSANYRSYDYCLTINPETGVAFTIAEVNALQTGVELA